MDSLGNKEIKSLSEIYHKTFGPGSRYDFKPDQMVVCMTQPDRVCCVVALPFGDFLKIEMMGYWNDWDRVTRSYKLRPMFQIGVGLQMMSGQMKSYDNGQANIISRPLPNYDARAFIDKLVKAGRTGALDPHFVIDTLDDINSKWDEAFRRWDESQEGTDGR